MRLRLIHMHLAMNPSEVFSKTIFAEAINSESVQVHTFKTKWENDIFTTVALNTTIILEIHSSDMALHLSSSFTGSHS